MYPCGGSTGSLEVLCRLLRQLDKAKSSVQLDTSDVQADASFKQIKTKMEELQLKMVREIMCREDRAMVQLGQIEQCIDGMMKGINDAQSSFSSSSSTLVVENLKQIDVFIEKAIAVVGASSAVYDGLYKRVKSTKEYEKKDGPWGPRLGTEWDMGPLPNIKIIYVNAGDRINSIRFEYKSDDREYQTPRIGGEGGTQHQIEIDAEEPIKFIRGRYDTAGLTKLEIITSKQTHSFGTGNGGSTVNFPPKSKLDCNYKVVGFFGRASSYVNAIGVYMEKCPNCPPDSSPNPNPNPNPN
ncbi:agglutinin-like [Curcuma longa]|uniref:agglutinin-like n=1 Tax=Curcuma longa TaxID=136217 RepID=UPI003D9F25C1